MRAEDLIGFGSRNKADTREMEEYAHKAREQGNDS